MHNVIRSDRTPMKLSKELRAQCHKIHSTGMSLTFCHEDFHEVWLAVNVTFHAREVSQATQKNDG